MFVMPSAIVALLSLYLSFLCFGLLVWTQSRPYGLCHCPYALAHIKGFGSPHLHVYACLLLCFMLVLASLVLGFATLDAFSEYVVVWLRLTPLKPFLDVTTWDALPWCRLLRANLSLFTPCNALFIMPICATHWLSMHFYTLAYMSIHESYLLLCCPYFNTMKLWTSNPNRHLSFADTTFCLPFCLFACFLDSLLAMPIMLVRFMTFHMLYIFSFHCLSVGFLSLPLHVHTRSEDAWS